MADDHADGAESLACVLDTCGCIPHTPHAALLELTLPQMAGWEVARAMRLDPRSTHTVMLAVTLMLALTVMLALTTWTGKAPGRVLWV